MNNLIAATSLHDRALAVRAQQLLNYVNFLNGRRDHRALTGCNADIPECPWYIDRAPVIESMEVIQGRMEREP